MSKREEEMVHCGVDVGAEELVAAAFCADRPLQRKVFANRAAGHRALIGWLGGLGGRVRVALEATGVYSLDLALALDDAEGVEVAVLKLDDGREWEQWQFRKHAVSIFQHGDRIILSCIVCDTDRH
jgi:hypothetical protein